MNEILILYTINKSQTTMYGISKFINKNYGSVTKPSFGTLQPALKKLEKNGYIFASKFYTEGGKPAFYYSITEEGKQFLKTKLLKNSSINPAQFLSMTKIKLACCDILDESEREILCTSLRKNLSKLKSEAESALSENWSNNVYHRLVLNNIICEYNNLMTLTEDLANARNS